MKFLLLFILILCFLSCKKSQKSKNNASSINYEELGNNITVQSQAAILVQLSSAIQKLNTDGAVTYCKSNINNIIDSLSKVHNCKIRRTSLKLRNPSNTPLNDDEVMILQQFHENFTKNQISNGRLIERDGKFIYYKPIITMMPTCLKCHGEPHKDIHPKTLQKIQELYPNDQAINYKLNEFRGMWVIEF